MSSSTSPIRSSAEPRSSGQGSSGRGLGPGILSARPDHARPEARSAHLMSLVSDVDEIPRREVLEQIIRERLYEGAIVALGMAYYRFFLNCKVAAPEDAPDAAVVASAERGRFGARAGVRLAPISRPTVERVAPGPAALSDITQRPAPGVRGSTRRRLGAARAGRAGPAAEEPPLLRHVQSDGSGTLDAGWHFSSPGRAMRAGLKKVREPFLTPSTAIPPNSRTRARSRPVVRHARDRRSWRPAGLDPSGRPEARWAAYPLSATWLGFTRRAPSHRLSGSW